MDCDSWVRYWFSSPNYCPKNLLSESDFLRIGLVDSLWKKQTLCEELGAISPEIT